jgi:hypothetical protein
MNTKYGVRRILFAGFLCCWLLVRIRLTSCGNHHNINLRVFTSMNTTVMYSMLHLLVEMLFYVLVSGCFCVCDCCLSNGSENFQWRAIRVMF